MTEGDTPGKRASVDLLSGWTRNVSRLFTIGCLLVVLLDNGPTVPLIRPDLLGRSRRSAEAVRTQEPPLIRQRSVVQVHLGQPCLSD